MNNKLEKISVSEIESRQEKTLAIEQIEGVQEITESDLIVKSEQVAEEVENKSAEIIMSADQRIDQVRSVVGLNSEKGNLIFENYGFADRIKTIKDKITNLAKSTKDKIKDLMLPQSSEKTKNEITEQKLLEGELGETKKLLGGSFDASFVNFAEGGGAVFKAYKYQNFEVYNNLFPNEAPRDNINLGEDRRMEKINAERGAYLVSKHLGMNIVPPTIIREIDGEMGSCQEFIEDAKDVKTVSEILRKEISNDEMLKLKILDLLIENNDRHNYENYLVKNGKIFAIDNGDAFFSAKSPIEVLNPVSILEMLDKDKHIFGVRLPKNIIGNIRQFISNSVEIDGLKKELGGMFGDIAADAYIERINAFARSIGENGVISTKKLEDELSTRIKKFIK